MKTFHEKFKEEIDLLGEFCQFDLETLPEETIKTVKNLTNFLKNEWVEHILWLGFDENDFE